MMSTLRRRAASSARNKRLFPDAVVPPAASLILHVMPRQLTPDGPNPWHHAVFLVHRELARTRVQPRRPASLEASQRGDNGSRYTHYESYLQLLTALERLHRMRRMHLRSVPPVLPLLPRNP